MRHREPSICLRTWDWSETSQVVCFLTRGQGLVRLVAKGTKRPKSKSGGQLDLLAEGDLVFTAKNEGLGTLIEFSESQTRRLLRRDPRRLYGALLCLELAGETLAEHDPHPEVFDLLHNALARLDEPDAPVAAVLAWFLWRLLRNIGLLGEMEACIGCGARLAVGDDPIFFTSLQGGLVCGRCAGSVREKVRIDRVVHEGLEVLAAVEARRRRPLPEETARRVGRLLAYHVVQQLGRPLKTARYVFEDDPNVPQMS